MIIDICSLYHVHVSSVDQAFEVPNDTLASMRTWSQYSCESISKSWSVLVIAIVLAAAVLPSLCM